MYEHILSTDDIELTQKRIENVTEHAAASQEEYYDPEPEIEDAELLDDMTDAEHEALGEQEIAMLLKLLDDGK